MSPSSVWDATEHPPAHTGMNAQSPHAFHAAISSKRFRALCRHGSRRPSMWPVDIVGSPVNPGHAYSDPSGPIVCELSRWIWHGPMWTPSGVGNPLRFVSSRKNDTLSSAKLQVSQTDPPAPADVMHVPLSGFPLLPTGINGRTPFGAGDPVRTI